MSEERLVSFGEALEAAKRGAKISRKGWNGKNQYVVAAYMRDCVTEGGIGIQDFKHLDCGSRFLLFVGTRGYQCGWLASQSDMLSEDWYIVD